MAARHGPCAVPSPPPPGRAAAPWERWSRSRSWSWSWGRGRGCFSSKGWTWPWRRSILRTSSWCVSCRKHVPTQAILSHLFWLPHRDFPRCRRLTRRTGGCGTRHYSADSHREHGYRQRHVVHPQGHAAAGCSGCGVHRHGLDMVRPGIPSPSSRLACPHFLSFVCGSLRSVFFSAPDTLNLDTVENVWCALETLHTAVSEAVECVVLALSQKLRNLSLTLRSPPTDCATPGTRCGRRCGPTCS